MEASFVRRSAALSDRLRLWTIEHSKLRCKAVAPTRFWRSPTRIWQLPLPSPDLRGRLGTRPARIGPGGSSVITLVSLPGNSSIRFLVASGRDSRDLLDQGVDLLLTRDPRTLDYAATLPQFQAAALPWQRTHVLLTPSRVRAVPSFSSDERRALAQDAVRGEARGAEGPYWWESLSDCEIDPPQAPPSDAIYSRAHRLRRGRQRRTRTGRTLCRHRKVSSRERAHQRCARSGTAAWERVRLHPVSGPSPSRSMP